MKTRDGIYKYFLLMWGVFSLSAQAQVVATEPSESEDDAEQSSDTGDDEKVQLDERFSTEGYIGVFLAGLQTSVPSVGVSASVFLDDDFRGGIDLWRGDSGPFFSSFHSQGTGLWATWEFNDDLWLKSGVSYLRLERPTAREPLSVLFGTKDHSDPRPVRTDSLQVDFSVGQIWSFPHFSLGAEYLGFSFPFLTLTGPKQTVFNLHALRFDFLYPIE